MNDLIEIFLKETEISSKYKPINIIVKMNLLEGILV